jgi:hypothetical protein
VVAVPPLFRPGSDDGIDGGAGRLVAGRLVADRTALATRDARARGTYDAAGVVVIVVT